jgi:LysW-gamma-L-alpha-aminoadipyl-6-phosphate/LysW-L-glutamyl-5-phosphate reductase
MLRVRVGIVGGAGYIGGELLRLLIGHPRVDVAAVTSTTYAKRRVDGPHPNLRALTDLTFVRPDDLPDCDLLFVAMRHRESMRAMPELTERAQHVIDLSGDFRLTDPAVYRAHYGVEHAAPQLLGTFVPGIPEWHRDRLRAASRIAVPGCMATAAILALLPLVAAGRCKGEVDVDALTGSSGSGAAVGQNNTHAERSGAMRVFAPAGHRHAAEIEQATGLATRMSAIGVEAVRGAQVICRLRVADGIDPREARAIYRQRYADEPFIRIVAHDRGAHRLPEPKLLAGSNFCDIGFAVGRDGEQLVLVSALDNLMKGGAGNAVQCMNVCFGWPERLGLEFAGLHPC